MKCNIKNYSPLMSDRLIFKPLSHRDGNFIQHYLSDEERTRYLPLGHPYSKKEADDWLNKRVMHWGKNNFGVYSLLNKESEKSIGYCGLEYVIDSDCVEICYGLTQDSWGQGFAFEAAKTMINHGLETVQLNTIYGAALHENMASIKILNKCGMRVDESFNIYGNSVKSFSISLRK